MRDSDIPTDGREPFCTERLVHIRPESSTLHCDGIYGLVDSDFIHVPQVDNNATCSRRSRKMRVATSTNSKVKAEVDGELYCCGYIFLRSYQYNAAL